MENIRIHILDRPLDAFSSSSGVPGSKHVALCGVVEPYRTNLPSDLPSDTCDNSNYFSNYAAMIVPNASMDLLGWNFDWRCDCRVGRTQSRR